VWGACEEERQAIRTYLRIVWQENNKGTIVEASNDFEGVEHERDSILKVSNPAMCIGSNTVTKLLQWWWSNRWSESPPDINDSAFGYWLLQQYRDANKIRAPNNKQMGRNK
jgi:hypothetical protein